MTTLPPETIRIGINVDLVNGIKILDADVAYTQKMTSDNYVEVIGKAFTPTDFESSITKYDCVVCKGGSTIDNPIWTNPDYAGCDICSRCMDVAFLLGIQPLSESECPFKNCYSLKALAELVKNAGSNV
jgi:hypothetical protein